MGVGEEIILKMSMLILRRLESGVAIVCKLSMIFVKIN